MLKKIFLTIIMIFIATSVYADSLDSLEITGPEATNTYSSSQLQIKTNNLDDIYGIYIKISYDTEYIRINQDSIDLSQELSNKAHFIGTNSVDSVNGEIVLVLTLLGDEEPIGPNNVIGTINFTAIKEGQATISITNSKLLKKDGTSLDYCTNTYGITITDKENKPATSKSYERDKSLYSFKIGANEYTIEVNNSLRLLILDNSFEEGTVLNVNVLNSIDGSITPVYDVNTDASFNGKIKLSIKLPEGFDTSSTALYYYNEDINNWIYIKSEINNGYIEGWVSHFTIFTVFQNDSYKEYSDTTNHWAKGYISTLTMMGVVNGVDNYSFNPQGEITRAEIAKILSSAFNLEYIGKNKAFRDNSEFPLWAEQHINNMVSMGYMSSYEDSTFRPNVPLTRIEMVVILDRILDSTGSTSELPFTDDNILPPWGRDAVYKLKSLGVIDGYEDGTFKPNNILTRAESCKIIVRFLEAMGIIM